jgi:hypothetical protein
MIKFLMALAMAALIGAAVVAAMNNKQMGVLKKDIELLTREFNQLNSDLDQTNQSLETARVALQTSQTANQQVKADKSLAEDELRRKSTEVERLTANFESRKVQLDELALMEEKIGNQSPEVIASRFEALKQRKAALEAELRTMEEEVVKAQNAEEKARETIGDLAQQEEKRRASVRLQGLEADLIAINREMGFVIINAGSDHGVAPESSLLVMRGNDRIGRLRIVSVEPKVTVADIMPGSVMPGASLMVRDKVIFDSVR